MYHYVTDKEFLKQSHSICADIVNQLVQRLKKYDVYARASLVGSGRRGLITQNENGPIDYDYNLHIEKCDFSINDCRKLKETVMKAFNEVLKANGWDDCKDSTSVITTEQRVLNKGNKTPFSIDVCIVRVDFAGRWNRLIHEKTGNTSWDRYFWNQGPRVDDINKKEEFLKPEYWQDVREAYLNKKKMYLSRQDDNHTSFICYHEAINEVYDKVAKKQNQFWTINSTYSSSLWQRI